MLLHANHNGRNGELEIQTRGTEHYDSFEYLGMYHIYKISKDNLYMNETYTISIHITPYSRYYTNYTQESSTHTLSHGIKAGLSTPNIHKVCIHRPINNRVKDLQSRGAYVSIKK
jgi:hypothetical protein